MSEARDFGERLVLAQRRKGWTQKELAEASGVATATIRRALAGQYDPRLATAGKLAEALGVDIKWLLFGDDRKDVDR